MGPVREYGPFLVAVLLLLAICGPRFAGIDLVFAVPLAMVWLTWRSWGARRSPVRRRILGGKTAVLVIAFAAIAIAHFSYSRAARAEAQKVVDAVLSFKAREGQFPERVADMGFDEAELKREHIYFARHGASGPIVFYLGTFAPFSTYRFDFESNEWLFELD